MRRMNTGAVRRLPTAGQGPAADKARGRPGNAEPAAPQRTLSLITVAPVFMALPAVDESSSARRLVESTAFVRAAPAIDARSIGKRILDETNADVLFFDARHCRPSVLYRAIVRARSGGWARGIVVLLDPDDMAVVPIASSVGASDFVLSSAAPEEVEARLRRAAAPAEQASRSAAASEAGIQLHWRTHQVSFEETSISLTLREMQLLSVLIERAGVLVTAEDLSREAWGKRRNRGSSLTAAYVCSLRKKLAWFGGRFGIQTIRAVGYRFVL